MKKEELVIKNTLQMTKEADEHLSIYATKNSDCIKIKQTITSYQEKIKIGDIEIEMSGWLVGSTHDCYNPDPEE